MLRSNQVGFCSSGAWRGIGPYSALMRGRLDASRILTGLGPKLSATNKGARHWVGLLLLVLDGGAFAAAVDMVAALTPAGKRRSSLGPRRVTARAHPGAGCVSLKLHNV